MTARERLEALLARLRAGDPVRRADVEGLERAIREEAPGLDADGVRALLALVESVRDEAARRRSELASELGRIGRGRRALRGYGGLRGRPEAGTRLFRRA